MRHNMSDTIHCCLDVRRLTGVYIPLFVSSLKSHLKEAEGFYLVDETMESFKTEANSQEVHEDGAALPHKTEENLLHATVGTDLKSRVPHRCGDDRDCYGTTP